MAAQFPTTPNGQVVVVGGVTFIHNQIVWQQSNILSSQHLQVQCLILVFLGTAILDEDDPSPIVQQN